MLTRDLLTWGVPESDVEPLAAAVAASPAEPGHAATPSSRALDAAIVAAMTVDRFHAALRALLRFAREDEGALDGYDRGRLHHLHGFVHWRLESSVSAASRAFTQAERHLRAASTLRAARYLPRVHDTRGQMLHAQGMLAEARAELEDALRLREPHGEDQGLAITLGNLGRLCLDLGDPDAARGYLARDLDLVERTTPERTRIRALLHTHLAECATARGDVAAAREHGTRARDLAREGGDVAGAVHAALALGRVKLLAGDAAGASEDALSARDALSRLPGGTPGRQGLLAKADRLAADAWSSLGDPTRAAKLYRSALEAIGVDATTAPMERAELLAGMARALAKSGDPQEAAVRFRDALRSLDATAAPAHRKKLERELKAHSLDAWLLHSAGRFIGQRHVQQLLADAGNEGFQGRRMNVVALFSDIRGFTTLSERLEPAELIDALNDLLARMTHCIEMHGGTIDKFMGDAVMAVFSAETDTDDGPVLAALAMQGELERRNLRLPEGGHAVNVGVGLHAGVVTAGLIGSPQKREYTIIGDVVNSASRLEGMTKQLGASILVSDAVVSRLGAPSRFLLRPLGRYAPKGRAKAIRVFDVMGERDGTPEAKRIDEEISLVKAALETFEARSFAAAADAFAALGRRATGTGREPGYALLRHHAETLADAPPSTGWCGEIALEHK